MRNAFAIALVISLALITTATALSPSGNNNDAKPEIEHVLRTQQEAWNRHDLDGFMAGYWNSPDLTFFSGAKEHEGWRATMDRYRATYTSPGHEMGKLEFSSLRVEMLGANAAFVRGVWGLTMSDAKTPHGVFTLLFRRLPEGWKIVHDHTSAAEEASFWRLASSSLLTCLPGPALV